MQLSVLPTAARKETRKRKKRVFQFRGGRETVAADENALHGGT